MVDVIIPAVFVLYIIGVLALGTYSGKGLKTFDQFSVMGRGAIGPLIVATLAGTIIGAGATLGTSGSANSQGITAIITLAIPWGLTLAVTSYLGNPLWEIGKDADAHTLGDAAGHYYGKPTQLTIGLLGVIMVVPALGAQVAAAGSVFSAVLPFTYNQAVIIGGAILIVYSTIAGMRGVVMTDWLQFVTLMLIIPGTALFLLFTVGIDSVAQSADPSAFDWTGGRTLFNLVSFAALIFASETLAPYYVGRLFAGNDRPGKRGYVAALTSTTYMISAIGLGMMGLVVLPEVTGESIIPQMLVESLPGIVGAVGAAALFAVLMSSSDSALNAVAVILVRDFYKLFAEPDDRTQLQLGRIATAVIGVLAVVAAIAVPSVLDLLVLGYYYWAPTVLIVVSLMLLTKRANFTPYTPPVAMLGTAAFVTIWYAVGQPYGIEPFLPAVGVNVVLLVGYHYLSKTVALVPSGEETVVAAGQTAD